MKSNNIFKEIRLIIKLLAIIVLGLMLFGSIEINMTIKKSSTGIIQTITNIADGAFSIYNGIK